MPSSSNHPYSFSFLQIAYLQPLCGHDTCHPGIVHTQCATVRLRERDRVTVHDRHYLDHEKKLVEANCSWRYAPPSRYSSFQSPAGGGGGGVSTAQHQQNRFAATTPSSSPLTPPRFAARVKRTFLLGNARGKRPHPLSTARRGVMRRIYAMAAPAVYGQEACYETYLCHGRKAAGAI
jgi:hypothetical protein